MNEKRENGVPDVKAKAPKKETKIKIEENEEVTEVKTPKKETEIKARENEESEAEELDAILKEANNFTAVTSMSEKEIDQLVEKRQKSLDNKKIKIANISEGSWRMRIIKNNPFKNLKPSDYKQLEKEKMISKAYSKQLKELDLSIANLESLTHPSVGTKARLEAQARLEKLSEIRNIKQEKIKNQIEKEGEKMADRQERVKSKLLEYNEERIEHLERIIKEIESNPRVIERLQVMEKEERRIFEAKIEKERKEIIKETIRYIQSLDSRHKDAFKRIAEIIGDENIRETLEKTLTEGNPKEQQSVFDSVRDHLKNSIISGEDEMQLKNPGEIVPWKNGYTNISYGYAIRFLNSFGTKKILRDMAKEGDKQAQKLLEDIKKIVITNDAISKLVVSMKNPFGAAFETRKKNDQDGTTEALKKEREEIAQQKEISRKEIEEVVERGGFIVSIPIFKKVRGKIVEDGREKGAVRLEEFISEKKNPCWRVVEVVGAAIGKLEIGKTSQFNMGSFPLWLRESYQLHLDKMNN